MTGRTIRRWFQFGVLDLFVLTAIVAVALPLFQPVESKLHKGVPWLFGMWEGGNRFVLHPDGWCEDSFSRGGFEWTLNRHTAIPGAFVLSYGEKRLIVRSDWGTGVMDVLNPDGTVQQSLMQTWCLEGPVKDGKAHGTWVARCIVNDDHGPDEATFRFEYRAGELVAARGMDGELFELRMINAMRRMRKLPPLAETDVPVSREE